VNVETSTFMYRKKAEPEMGGFLKMGTSEKKCSCRGCIRKGGEVRTKKRKNEILRSGFPFPPPNAGQPADAKGKEQKKGSSKTGLKRKLKRRKKKIISAAEIPSKEEEKGTRKKLQPPLYTRSRT